MHEYIPSNIVVWWRIVVHVMAVIAQPFSRHLQDINIWLHPWYGIPHYVWFTDNCIWIYTVVRWHNEGNIESANHLQIKLFSCGQVFPLLICCVKRLARRNEVASLSFWFPDPLILWSSPKGLAHSSSFHFERSTDYLQALLSVDALNINRTGE